MYGRRRVSAFSRGPAGARTAAQASPAGPQARSPAPWPPPRPDPAGPPHAGPIHTQARFIGAVAQLPAGQLLAPGTRLPVVRRTEQRQPDRRPDPVGGPLQHRRLRRIPLDRRDQCQQFQGEHRAEQVVEGMADRQGLLEQLPGPARQVPLQRSEGQYVQRVREGPPLPVVVQALQHLLGGQGAQPSGGQFQRERDPVQSAAQLPRGCAIMVGQPELRPHCGGPLREEQHRVLVRHRCERERELAVQFQGQPPGGEHPQQRGAGAAVPVPAGRRRPRDARSRRSPGGVGARQDVRGVSCGAVCWCDR